MGDDNELTKKFVELQAKYAKELEGKNYDIIDVLLVSTKASSEFLQWVKDSGYNVDDFMAWIMENKDMVRLYNTMYDSFGLDEKKVVLQLSNYIVKIESKLDVITKRLDVLYSKLVGDKNEQDGES